MIKYIIKLEFSWRFEAPNISGAIWDDVTNKFCSVYVLFRLLLFLSFLSFITNIKEAALLRSEGGNLLTTPVALLLPQLFVTFKTSRNLITPLSFESLYSKQCLAVVDHSLARLHGIPNLFDKPLIRILLLPTRTKSWGKDFSSLTGEFGLSSPLSYPPGSVSTEPSNNHIATAAGASSFASSLSSTPSSRAKLPINSKSSGFVSLWRSSRAIITFASVCLALPEICFT
mmetsp:Transcript_6847/g.9863  ORF Transcript_6847/g.9863 Transcript_6847/m.9863 type:complete len:229 (-) Transcript_6847:1268-1954(-)